MKTPDKITFEQLAKIAESAGRKADEQARAAGIAVAGLRKKSRKAKSNGGQLPRK